MDAVGIAIIICVVVGLVIAAVVGVIAFMAGSSHRKKSAEATIGSAEEEAKKIIEEAVKTAEAKKNEAVLEGKDRQGNGREIQSDRHGSNGRSF